MLGAVAGRGYEGASTAHSGSVGLHVHEGLLLAIPWDQSQLRGYKKVVAHGCVVNGEERIPSDVSPILSIF